MKSEEIKKLVAKSENAAVEFKRARGGVPADFWSSYSAFANTDGGTVILGVREKDGKCEVEGLPDVEKTVADIWNAVNNAEKISANVLFNESVYPVEVDGKRLVVVEVPRAERTVRPVYVGVDVFKGTYRRNGEGDYHCSRETVEGMIRDKCAETADNCVLDELTIADLDADSIRRYRMYFSQLQDVNAEVKMKKTVSEDVNRISDDEKQGSGGEKGEFDILMGAYRNDFRENARKVLAAFAEDPEADIPSVAKRLGFSSISVWRAIRAMKEVGLLVREGGDKGGKWIVKK